MLIFNCTSGQTVTSWPSSVPRYTHMHSTHMHNKMWINNIVITEGLMNRGVIPSREEVPIESLALPDYVAVAVVEYSVSRSQTLDSLIVCTHFAT